MLSFCVHWWASSFKEQKNIPLIDFVPNVLPMWPRSSVGCNVFLVSFQCLFSVFSVSFLRRIPFNPWQFHFLLLLWLSCQCNFVTRYPPWVEKKIYFIHTVMVWFINCNSVLSQKFPWTCISIDCKRSDKKHNKCGCAPYVVVSFATVARIAF